MALEKLKIESYADEKFQKKIGEIEAFINPENYSQNLTINHQPNKASGSSGETMAFDSMGKTSMSFVFWVDGTGLMPLKGASSVEDYIKKLKKTVYDFHGTTHRPPFLIFRWGSLLFKCVCDSLNVEYKLFNPDGKALRAKVTVAVTERKDHDTLTKEAGASSPDLTHQYIFRKGDSLPLMAREVYGDSSYYLQVAEVNGLSDFRNITPGQKIYFPPLKR